MSKFPLDLSKFKVSKKDAKSTTLQHPAGHSLVIAHNSLSPKLKTQLDGLGKMAEMDAEPSDPLPEQRLAKGGKVQKMADGDPSVSPNPEPNLPSNLPAPLPDNMDREGNHLVANKPNPQPQVADSSSLPDDASREPAKVQSGPDPFGINAYTNQQVKALGEQKAGQIGAEAAKAQQATAGIAPEQSYQDSIKNALNTYQNSFAAISDERAKIKQNILDGQINPRNYIDNMSTGDKVRTGIGLVLGGMGAGLTHGPNLAFNYLQNQITNDIDAQKANLGSQNSLLSHNFQEMGDLKDATNMALLQTNDMLGSHMRMLADQAATPMQKAQALTIAGQFDAKASELQHNMAIQKALLGGQGGSEQDFQNKMTYLKMNGQADLAKDMETKHIPGVAGSASVNLTPENRQSIDHLNNLSQSYTDAQNYLNHTSAFGVGWQNANRAAGTSIMNRMELEIGALEGLGRFTPEEAKRYKGMIPDLTGTHFTGQDQARLDQLTKEVNEHKANLLGNVGVGGGAKALPHEIRRVTKDGKTAVYDSNKKFLRYE